MSEFETSAGGYNIYPRTMVRFSVIAYDSLTDIPGAVQALGWDGIRPWHWAVAVMAACSVGMLWIAGRAVQKDENKHWPAYQKAGLRRDLRCMDMLKRIRFLAMLFFWGTGLLALLLETKVIPEKIPLPARQTEALREWFAGDSPVPKGDSQPR